MKITRSDLEQWDPASLSNWAEALRAVNDQFLDAIESPR